MRIWVFSLVVSFTVAASLQAPERAFAGPVEEMAQVVLHPADPDVMALRYTFGGDGLLYSDDGGMSFKLVCLSAISVEARKIHSVGMAGDGRVAVGHFDGLFVDQGSGCGFTAESSLSDMWVSDVAVDPTDPMVLYAATSASAPGGTALPNGMFKRAADGTFAQFGTLEEVQITRMRLVATDGGMRIYQSAIDGTTTGVVDGMQVDGVSNYVVRYSDDGAQTFTTFPYGAGDGGAFRVVAVDPTNPDRIVGVLDRTRAQDELLVSTDRGETFTSYHTLTQLGAIELAPDGRVFIGEGPASYDASAPVGFWAAASLDEPPQKLGDYPTMCLGYQAATDTLFACQRWSFGTIDPESGEYSERITFKDVDEFVSCDGVDMAATCKRQLCADWCGLAHFAEAGICAGYEDPFCGRCVALMEAGMPDPTCGMSSGGAAGSAGAAQDGGAAGAVPTGGTGSGPQGGTSGGAGEGGAGGGAGGGGDDGGCACSAPGRDAGVPSSMPLAGVLLALAWLARRRR